MQLSIGLTEDQEDNLSRFNSNSHYFQTNLNLVFQQIGMAVSIRRLNFPKIETKSIIIWVIIQESLYQNINRKEVNNS